MQAIILAAGMGKRLGDLTKENTKCMVKICGITLIERMLDQIVTSGFSQVVIVVGYFGYKLMNLIGDNYKGIPIKYVENSAYQTTNNIYSLYLAKDYLLADDTVLFESDLIFDNTILADLLNNPYPNLSVVAKFESWMNGTVVVLDNEKHILSFIPKGNFDFAHSCNYYKTVNLYKFSKSFASNYYVPFLEAYSRTVGNNEYYEDVLRVMAFIDHSRLKAHIIDQSQKWYEIDDIQDVDIAETLFSKEEDGKLVRYQKRYGGYWRFPRLLDFCYLVNPYFPTQKIKEEIKMNFDTLLSEYPSGMEVNCLLASKYFGVKRDYLVVGNGASELIQELMDDVTDKIGITFPTFEEYYNRKDGCGVVSYKVPNLSFQYCATELMDFFADKNINSLLLVNPDNPSGNFIPIDEVLIIASWAKERGITFILDESFVDFSIGSTGNSLLRNDILERYPNMVIIKSISKSYGVPGIRLGILASSDTKLIERMRRKSPIWNINSFAEFYMQIFNKYEEDYHIACQKIIEVRSSFMQEMSSIEYLRVIPSMANYFLCEVLPPFTAKELTSHLLSEYDILVKDCSAKAGFDSKEFIRIAIRAEADNKILIDALKCLALLFSSRLLQHAI